MSPTIPAQRPTRRPIRPRGTSTPTTASATVLVIAARGDTRGAAAAEAYAAVLRDTGPGTTRVVATHAGAPDLADRIGAAVRIHVLDPGRVRAWRERRRARADGRPRALTAPARTADRLALLGALRDLPSRVRWVTR